MQEYDVLVAGGGIAGVAAAVSSARAGAKTLLVERYGFLGGLSTAGLVNPFMTYRASNGVPLIAGFFAEMLEKLEEFGGLNIVSFDSEAMKYVLQEMALEAGVELRLHSPVADVLKEGSDICGVTLLGKGTKEDFRAKRIVDTTGDGDVAAMAGAPFEVGDSKLGFPQAMTLMIDIGGVDIAKALVYVRDNPDDMRFPKLPPDTDLEAKAKGVVSVSGYYSFVSQAKAKGEYSLPGDLVFYIVRPRTDEVVMNTTHVGNVDGTSISDLTYAEIESRRQAVALAKFLKDYIPGFENCYLLRTAPQIGVRETRRITGEYAFSADDVARAAKFPDAIARLAYSVDVHSPKGDGYVRADEKVPPIKPPPGDWYEIPYRCLVPLEIENLLVAGRCVSSTHEGQGAIRIMPCCAAMGQAAGAAAALSIKSDVSPRHLDFATLKDFLISQGALL